jgi:splicing factor 3B subunit 1
LKKEQRINSIFLSRDVVHRQQIAIDAVAHLSLGAYGFGCEDALVHLLNYVWPNMLENSPHGQWKN